MTEINQPAGRPTRRRRADADRSRTATLQAAISVLAENPEASVENIATAAGVTRQTVYAHFPSRDALLIAVADHLTTELLAEYEQLDLETGTAMDALLLLIDTGQTFFERHPVQLYPAAASGDPQRHQPINDLLTKTIRRGQRNGEFTKALPATWLADATIALSHTAANLAPRKSTPTLHTTLRRLLLTE
ncbi:TetR/AcrR family transcriptional regulator [Kribbella sp. NPDC023855]|uniref:TetR/AcrR family transcriptional regulator n=1 Tax=Kribbella sp. NPDC023855 TaxID=3154698 RepID=UPI0033FD9CD1